MAISPHRVSSYWGHISLVDSDLGGNSIFNRKMTELFGPRIGPTAFAQSEIEKIHVHKRFTST